MVVMYRYLLNNIMLVQVLLRETDLGQVAETSYSSSDEDGASANDDSFSSKAINTSTDMSSDSESEEEKEGGVNARSTDSELSNFDQVGGCVFTMIYIFRMDRIS